MNSAVPSIKPICVLVLGMHRSGTSALTRCLNLVGTDLGSHLLSPKKMNAKGFWEHADAVRINDELLASFGLLWHSLEPLPEGWLGSAAADVARAEIRMLVKRDFDGVPLWGIKDPRMCRLAPLWIEVLQDMGIQVVSVLLVRSPLEVAASLHRAHRLSVQHGVLLWAQHLAESDLASRSVPRVMVEYEQLLSDALTLVSRIGVALGLAWPIAPEERREAMLAFLDEGLRTHHTQVSAGAVPPMVGEMVQACAAIVADPSPEHWKHLAVLTARVQEQIATLAYLGSPAEVSDQLPPSIAGWVPHVVLYISTEDMPFFSESQSVSKPIPPGRNQIDLALPLTVGNPLRLRLDPLDRRGGYALHSLVFLDPMGRVVWDWSMASDEVELVGVREADSLVDNGRKVAYTDGDPQINIAWPHGVNSRGVAVVRVDMECLDSEHLSSEIEALIFSRERAAEQFELERTQLDQRVVSLRSELGEVQVALEGKLAHAQATFESKLGDAQAASEKKLELARTALESSRREIDRLGAIQLAQAREMATIQSSTLWQILLRLGALLSHIPPGTRAQLRRGFKALWWAATPWRLPARLRFLRQRDAARTRAASAPAPSRPAISFVPAQNNGSGAAGHYTLSERAGQYTYVPPRPPKNLKSELDAMESHPRFSIVVPVYNTPPGLLAKLVRSVCAQWYPHWELILVNDNSSAEHVRQDLDSLSDPRIVVMHLAENKRIALATNEGIARATGDYIVFADHDDELTVDCLYELALSIARDNPDFVYSDEDKLDGEGQYVEPFFKPDWSPDTMMSTMFTCHVSCVRRELVVSLGGLRPEYDGSQDWDFILRVVEKTNRIAHIPKVLYHWRIIPASVASDLNAKPYAVTAGKRAREDALARRGLEGELEPVKDLPGYYRTVYHLRGEPVVSIVIPSKNNHAILRQCIDSIQSKSNYAHYEIVVIDNGSTDPATRNYVDGLQGQDHIKVLSYDKPFNYSAINNLGAAQASGDLLLFLNDDTEVLVPDWLQRLGGYAQRDHVGAVGAKLLYPGGQRVQHVGVVNLATGPVHAFVGAAASDPCYFARAVLEYNWLAVTGACLMVERAKFEQIGGFDEALPVAYNDVDLCFRLSEAGFYNVVSPGVELIHHESFSRGLDAMDPAKYARLRRDMQALYQKHPRFYQHDPFHNPNLGSRDAWFRWPQ